MREIKFLPFIHVVAESPRSFSGSKPLEFSDGNCNQSEGRQLDSFRQFSTVFVANSFTADRKHRKKRVGSYSVHTPEHMNSEVVLRGCPKDMSQVFIVSLRTRQGKLLSNLSTT